MEHTVVAIQFNRLGKKYYFDTSNINVTLGDKVVVETARGIELGTVVSERMTIKNEELVSPLKPIVRLANEYDLRDNEENAEREPIVLKKTEEFVKKNRLEMKLLNCEYTLDRSKLIIYFNAEGRVDFRELVKDLANEFHVRIELRQVGTRDGAKVLGGLGPCGRETCCTRFLTEFQPVSIKMAKNQNLSLNPNNISGICGKLLCCIKYEDDNYKEMRKSMPKLNSKVQTPDGMGTVSQVNYIMQQVTVMMDGSLHNYSVNELAGYETDNAQDDLSVEDKELLNLEE
ncbi:MAG: stage 0 sporulation family protein [Bacilli bacterium]|nr:stage 0 sporulation family protein [Bacilli bacterium]MBN2876988.1 stage 0 sporulation family protein [Bacilli bacterium]